MQPAIIRYLLFVGSNLSEASRRLKELVEADIFTMPMVGVRNAGCFAGMKNSDRLIG